ncbi:MAG: sortase [Chloroflexi bacterium]|nr:sortase [Chloroflexota bacterium]
MAQPARGRNLFANLLIIAGVIVLLGAGGCLGWREYQGQQLRSRLQQTPAAAALNPTATPAPPTASPTAAPPTATPGPTAQPSPVPTQTPASVAVTATAVPSPQPTRPQPTVTPAPSPAPIAGGPPVRLVIPDLKIDTRVVEMGWRVVDTSNGPQSEWDLDAIQNGVGHHLNSALLGESGNVVISGHNNIYGREFEAISLAWDDTKRQRVDDFTDRSDLLNGRTIQLYDAAGQRFDYTITEFYRLKDTGVSLEQRIANGRFMEPTDDARLTLVTCWPIWSNTHRLVVVAKPVKQP